MQFIYDNDFAQAASFNVEREAGETTFYLLALGGGYVENIGGTINGVDVTSPAVAATESPRQVASSAAARGAARERHRLVRPACDGGKCRGPAAACGRSKD
jgi:hypothetical protein